MFFLFRLAELRLQPLQETLHTLQRLLLPLEILAQQALDLLVQWLRQAISSKKKK